MDRAFQQPLDDRDLLRLLAQPSSLALPPAINEEGDPLGLIEFRHPRDAVAEQIFHGFSYVCSLIVRNNPEVRAQFARDVRMIEFPTVTLAGFHRFGVRWYDDEDGTSTYEFYRADKGNPGGGFFVVQKVDGSTVLRRSLKETPDEEDYDEILGAAQRSLLVYAQKLSVSIATLSEQSHTDHLDENAVRNLSKRAKAERKFYRRLLKQTGVAASRVGNSVYGIFTKETDTSGRKLSIGRVALAALLLPLPGYSAGMFGTPLPRPASVEMVVDGGRMLVDAMTPDKKPDLELLYDNKQQDLPAEALVSASESAVAVIAVPEGAGSHKVIDFGYGGLLHGTSPRRVLLREDLRPNFCQRLGIDGPTQDNELYVGTTNGRMVGELTVQSTGAAVFVCNKTDRFINKSDMDLVFDSRPKT